MPSRPKITWSEFEATPNNEGRAVEIFMAAMRQMFESGVPVTHASASLPYGADYVALAYTGAFVTTATYKTGGSGGTTVKTLTFANDGTNYTSITAA